MHAKDSSKQGGAISRSMRAVADRLFIATSALVFPAVIAVTFLEILDATVVSVSLPYISGSLSVSSNEAAWGILAYICANSVMLLLAGAITRRLGLRSTFLLSVAAFAVASALCSTAPSAVVFSLWRALQGAAGGVMYPIAYASALEAFPKAGRGRAIAILGFITTLAPTVGPVLGGWLTESFGWQLIFLLNVPVALGALLVLILHYWPQPFAEPARRPHIPSVLLLLAGTFLFQLILLRGAYYGWFRSALIAGLCAVTVLACLLFVAFQLWSNKPLVHLRRLSKPSFWIGSALILVHNLTFFGSTLLLPLLLEEARGLSSLTAGVYVAPRGIGSLVGMLVANPLLRRARTGWTLALAQLCIAGALLWLAHMPLDVGGWVLACPQLLAGIGSAVGYVAIASLAFSEFPQEDSVDASAIFGYTASVGASLGVAAATTLLTSLQQEALVRFSEGSGFYGRLLRERERVLSTMLHDHFGHVAASQVHALFAATIEPQAQLLATAMLYRDLAAAALSLSLLASAWAVVGVVRGAGRKGNAGQIFTFRALDKS